MELESHSEEVDMTFNRSLVQVGFSMQTVVFIKLHIGQNCRELLFTCS